MNITKKEIIKKVFVLELTEGEFFLLRGIVGYVGSLTPERVLAIIGPANYGWRKYYQFASDLYHSMKGKV